MVCPDWFPIRGGLSQTCYELCRELVNHGHELRVVVAGDETAERKGLEVFPVPHLGRLLGRNPIAYRLWHHTRRHVDWCDVIVLFSYMFEMNSRLVRLRQKGKFGKPVILFYVGSLDDDLLPHLSFPTRLGKIFYDRIFGRRLFTQVNRVISNADIGSELQRRGYDTPQGPVRVHGAIHVADYPYELEERQQVVFVGRLVENKGVRYFPEIAQALPPGWSFVIVGDGPDRKRVQEWAAKQDNVEALGTLSHEETKQVIGSSAALVLPTFAEGSPRVVMEASACGIPSIAFAVGDVRNMIPPECGFAIERFDIKELCARLHYLVTHPTERRTMGGRARELVKAQFDWTAVYPAIEATLYEERHRSIHKLGVKLSGAILKNASAHPTER